jgi:hypothetical protein
MKELFRGVGSSRHGDAVIDFGQQVLRRIRAQKALIRDGSTVLDRHKFDRADRAVTNRIPGGGLSVDDRLHRSIRHWRAQPRQVSAIVIDLDDEPLASREITGAAQRRSLVPGKHNFDGQLKIKPTEPQHGHSFPTSQRGLEWSHFHHREAATTTTAIYPHEY